MSTRTTLTADDLHHLQPWRFTSPDDLHPEQLTATPLTVGYAYCLAATISRGLARRNQLADAILDQIRRPTDPYYRYALGLALAATQAQLRLHLDHAARWLNTRTTMGIDRLLNLQPPTAGAIAVHRANLQRRSREW